MHQTGFVDKLDRRMVDANSLVCVGLDPNLYMLPTGITPTPESMSAFCSSIIEYTHEFAAAYKPNLAFFTQLGRKGLDVLADVCHQIPSDVPVILDCKVGDIGETARAYAHSWFAEFGFDAITANPYLGEDAIAPFLGYEGRGVIVVCKTSNPGSGDFQDLTLQGGTELYLKVAERCAEWHRTYPASVGVVVGSTYPEQLRQVRARVGDQVILLPGVGSQGGDVASSLDAGLNSKGLGLMASASRSIIHAGSGKDFGSRAGEAARTLRDEINRLRHTAVVA